VTIKITDLSDVADFKSCRKIHEKMYTYLPNYTASVEVPISNLGQDTEYPR
jgi:hypothetical protein